MYKVYDNYSEFDGDFTQYLLDIGVEAEHIEKMKNKILENPHSSYYDYISSEESILDVPLEKVIGTSRCTRGQSVYENVRYVPNIMREAYRFEDCFAYLEDMSLEELRESYANLRNPVRMEYYKEEDLYYLTEDGNHRTLTAMLLGAPKIKARVTFLRLNREKQEKYFATKKFFEEYNIRYITASSMGEYAVTFRSNAGAYTVRGFTGIRTGENCFDIIKHLKREIEEDKQIVNRISSLPQKMRNIALLFQRNRRVSQYLHRNDDSANIEYNNERKIFLYEY